MHIHRPEVGRGSLLLRLALLLVAATPQLAFAQADIWTRVSLTGDKPLWISSAAYIESLDKVGLIDPLHNSLLVVSPQGRSERFNSASFGASDQEMVPAFFSRTPDGYALSMVNMRLYRLDESLGRSEEVEDLSKAAADASGKIISTYDTVVAGSEFFSFGAVKPTDGGVHFGFYRAPVRNPGAFQVLLDFPQVNWYLLGHKLLAGAATGEKYAVLMGDKAASLVEFLPNRKTRALAAIPARYRAVPSLNTAPSGPDAEKSLFGEVERLTIPTGLYAQDGFLYLLTRQPNEKASGSTSWRLHQIEPKTGRLRGSVELPTTEAAHHLTVVNSAKNWYVFEKGAVNEQGAQAISSMLVIPNSQIRALCLSSSCQAHK